MPNRFTRSPGCIALWGYREQGAPPRRTAAGSPEGMMVLTRWGRPGGSTKLLGEKTARTSSGDSKCSHHDCTCCAQTVNPLGRRDTSAFTCRLKAGTGRLQRRQRIEGNLLARPHDAGDRSNSVRVSQQDGKECGLAWITMAANAQEEQDCAAHENEPRLAVFSCHDIIT